MQKEVNRSVKLSRGCLHSCCGRTLIFAQWSRPAVLEQHGFKVSLLVNIELFAKEKVWTLSTRLLLTHNPGSAIGGVVTFRELLGTTGKKVSVLSTSVKVRLCNSPVWYWGDNFIINLCTFACFAEPQCLRNVLEYHLYIWNEAAWDTLFFCWSRLIKSSSRWLE